MTEEPHGVTETAGASGAPADDPSATEPGRDSAPRRTHLAAERTYLAWLRSGLAALGIALAVGRLIPALIKTSHVEFALLGIGYAALGVGFLVIGAYRAQRVRTALAADQPLPVDAWTVWVPTVAGLVLAAATMLMLVAEI
jgi:putative membrane protein